MKTLTREELYKILEEHKHWINEDCKNWEECTRGIHFFINRQEAINY